MSANLWYVPVKQSRIDIPASAPQHLMDTLEEVFGVRLPSFTGEHIPLLRAMRSATSDKQMKACFDVLISGIDKYGEIQMGATY